VQFVEPNGGAVTPKRSGGFIVVTKSVRPILEAHMQQEVPLSHSTFRSCVRIECVPGMTKGGDLAK